MKVYNNLESAIKGLHDEARLARETMYLTYTIYGNIFQRVEYIIRKREELVGNGLKSICKYNPRTGYYPSSFVVNDAHVSNLISTIQATHHCGDFALPHSKNSIDEISINIKF